MIEKCPVAEYTVDNGWRTMPKVECFTIPGLTCWFWSNDHNPPHFHVKRDGEWELKVNFSEGEDQLFELVWGDAPKATELREIAKNVEENRVEPLTEWEENVI
jgi:hypothetical protein